MHALMILREAWESVTSNPRRGFLTILGLLIGVASVVTTMSAGQSVRALISSEMGILGRPTAISITPNWRYLASISWRKKVEPIERDDIAALSKLYAISDLSPVSELRHTTRCGARTRVARMLFVSPGYFSMERLGIEHGRAFLPDDDRLMRRVAVVGAEYARTMFASGEAVGKRITIGNFGEVEIIGVLRREGPSIVSRITSWDNSNDGTIFVTNSAASRFGADRWNYTLLLEAKNARLADAATAEALSILESLHGTWDGQPKFVAETGKGAMREIASMTGIFMAFVFVIGGISLIVAGIGVMNVMLISVRERTRELGTRKALGAKPSWIRAQISLESLILCLAGGLAGVVLAFIAVYVAARLAHWPAILSPTSVLIALGLSAGTSLVFGWIPAWRASRMDPVEALRYE